jgi:hypothetical protein
VAQTVDICWNSREHDICSYRKPISLFTVLLYLKKHHFPPLPNFLSSGTYFSPRAVCATPRATGRARALACLVRAFRRGEFCSRSPDRMCVGGRPSQVRSTAPPSSAIAGGTVGRRRRAAVVGGGASDGRRRLSMLLQTVHAHKGSLALRAAP